jgi:hypothetical protein
MPVIIDGTNGITQAGEFNSDSSFGFKNRIINGAMVIDQRNAGASTTFNFPGKYLVDRWSANNNTNGSMTAQQDSSAPVGFNNSLKFTTTAADGTVGAGEYIYTGQPIEGFNVADLGWGTANAKTITVSFWVRSSLTGTFGCSISNSAFNRSYPFTYTISVADTWEQKSVTIAGDTSGTWLTTNGIGIYLFFGLGMSTGLSGTAGVWAAAQYLSATGAVSVIGTLSATWYITGVQLEVGSTATSFDYRPYGTELALCQRYCRSYSSYPLGRIRDADTMQGGGPVFGITMRATPTLRSGASFAVSAGSNGTPQILSGVGYASSPDTVLLSNSASNWTATSMCAFTGIFEAEL